MHEFDFRYSNRSALGIEDAERTTRAIKGASGKRLTYRRVGNQPRKKGLTFKQKHAILRRLRHQKKD